MNDTPLKRFSLPLLFLLLALCSMVTILYFDGTGDAGDSVLHYLFARYAPFHPELFFDQWAKPVYVLLAFPFAQFGFVGIKIFNALVALSTMWLTYRTGQKMKLPNSLVLPLLMAFAPLFYILTFSGLTEPLFGLFVIAGFYLAISEKWMAACILLSFLPFVRSEGMIILGVFALYLLAEKKIKLLPLLLAGSLLYSLAGYPFHHDLLWVIHKIPYAKLSSTYGSGELFHFVNQLLYVVGIPVYLLFGIGMIRLFVDLFRQKIEGSHFILLVLGFGAFFVAHSLFWYLGIFNSMGLKRVLICVMPLIALIALYGFNTFSLLPIRFRKIGIGLQLVLLLYLLIFPFTSNPAAIKWQKDMHLASDQKMIEQVADHIKGLKGNTYPLLCTHPYLSQAMELDHFDTSKRLNLNCSHFGKLQKGSLLVWENWFAVLEENVTQQQLDLDSNFVKIKEWKSRADDRELVFAIYRKK